METFRTVYYPFFKNGFQKIRFIPLPLLFGIIGGSSTFLGILVYSIFYCSWKYIGILIGLSLSLAILSLGKLARKNPLVQTGLQIYLPSKIHQYGVRWYQSIYLLTNTYSLPISYQSRIPLSFVHWQEQADHFQINCSLTRTFNKIPKIVLPPGYVVEYHIDGQKYPSPINLEMEGSVDDGDFVLLKRIRKGMSFVLQECDRSSFWPTPELRKLLG